MAIEYILLAASWLDGDECVHFFVTCLILVEFCGKGWICLLPHSWCSFWYSTISATSHLSSLVHWQSLLVQCFKLCVLWLIIIIIVVIIISACLPTLERQSG